MPVIAIKDDGDFDVKFKNAGDKLIVVDFTATWCGPCKMIAPTFEELSNMFTDVVFLKVDVDECEGVCEKYKVSSMPTFLFFKKGAKVDNFSGANAGKLATLVEKYSQTA
ncbi:unnamed protein product [Caenorhabditis bovis]|uniref:Thioredoxin n=1 Tax=Caenorhabditis bovis TaxID=2654633 RepID=A0A8S1F3H2_9PELO|nr:unnamed protein product [Caenorhabditis bovis]